MADRLHLRPKHRQVLEALLREHLPDVEVWAYGSRVSGKNHEGSDLDLVLRGPGLKEIPISQLGDFEEAVRESIIPFLVEARDWARLPERFHREIERDHVALATNTRSTSESNGWVSLRLGDVCTKIGSGATPRGGKEVYLESGSLSLIRSQNVYNDGFKRDGIAYITEEQANQLSNVEVLPSDVLLNITGDSVARVCQVPSDVLPARVNQHVAIIRPDPNKLSARFLRYLLVCPETQSMLLSWAGSGGTRNALTKGMIESLDILAPANVTDQRAIAHILGTLDDKIELNRRMNETLEAMARALFKSWFVDFGPVRAKMEGRDPGLPKPLADLFPDRLVDSEIGKIPEGWEVRPLGEQVAVAKGLSYKGAGLTTAGRGMPLHNLNSINEGGGYKPNGLKFYSGEYKQRHVVHPGDLIATNTEQGFDHLLIGYSAIVPTWSGSKALFSHHIFNIRSQPSSPLSELWLHYAISASWMGGAIRRFSNGTTVNMLPADAFRLTDIVVPPSELVEVFSEIVGPMLKQQDDAVVFSRTLAALRDALLPKLISGKVRLREAEKVVEAVA